jgi:hypothetical protein
MIFRSSSKHIEELSPDQLVELMRRLLQVECRQFGIPLSSILISDQKTVKDGGEDARVQWNSNTKLTNYFKSDFCLFQAKAKKRLWDSDVKKEVLRIENKTKIVNKALDEVLKTNGDYILLCSKALVGQDIIDRKKAICEAIREVGRTPDENKIHIYDANMISGWVNEYPSVALWLASIAFDHPLQAFQTHASWGQKFSEAAWVDYQQGRFSIKHNLPRHPEDELNRLRNFDEIYSLVVEHLSFGQKKAIRIVGPSGYGKSRLAFELFNLQRQDNTLTDPASVIFADYSIVREGVTRLALEIAESSIHTTLVVDECPDSVHRQLVDIANGANSRFRLVSMDIETSIHKSIHTLTIDITPAPYELLAGIVTNTCPNLKDAAREYIIDLSQGFPKMAILAAKALENGGNPIDTLEELWEKIIWGRTPKDHSAQKSLEILALFDGVGFKGEKAVERDFVDKNLVNATPDDFEEHIKSFVKRGIIEFKGRFFQVVPIPLAAKLGKDRLSLFPDNKLIAFFDICPQNLKLSLLRRFRWLDTSVEAQEFARVLLQPGRYGNLRNLSSRSGAESFHRLTHINPDVALESLELIFNTGGIQDFKNYGDARYWVILSLEELAFQTATFHRAATILRKLAASESENWDLNNSITPFRRIFQVYLSNTQAALAIRLKTLEAGIISKQEKERETTIWAIDNMLSFPHFRQKRGLGQMGSTGPQQEYDPSNIEIEQYISSCIVLLRDIIVSNDKLAGYANKVFEARFRRILDWVSLPKIKELIQSISGSIGIWFSAIRGINEWLYCDGHDFHEDFEIEVQSLFTSLLPTDPLNLILLHTRWNHGLHSPESRLHSNTGGLEDYYSDNKLFELAEIVRFDQEVISKIIERLSVGDAEYNFYFCRKLAELVEDPIAVFQDGLNHLQDTGEAPNIDFFRGVLTGIATNNPDWALDCAVDAVRTGLFDENCIQLFDQLEKNPKTILLIVEKIEDGTIHPWECNHHPFITGVKDLSVAELSPLIDCLLSKGAEGVWPAIEILVNTVGKNPGSKVEFCQLSTKSFFAIERFPNNSRVKIRGHSIVKLLDTLLNCQEIIDDDLLTSLSKHIFKICEFSSKLYYAAETDWIKCLKLLHGKSAVLVWNSVVHYLNKPGYNNIKNMVLPSNEESDWLGSGLLYEVPEMYYLDWVEEDPKIRAHKVLWWLPVLSREPSLYSWHPKLEIFIKKYHKYPQVLDEFADRLTPKFLIQSTQVTFGPIITCLEAWKISDNKLLSEWAVSLLEPLHRKIKVEKLEDQEFEI